MKNELQYVYNIKLRQYLQTTWYILMQYLTKSYNANTMIIYNNNLEKDELHVHVTLMVLILILILHVVINLIILWDSNSFLMGFHSVNCSPNTPPKEKKGGMGKKIN